MKYVYLLKGTNGFYKIGISENLESRINNINTSNPDSISLVTAKPVETPLLIEQELHRKYDKYKTKVNGEWFSFTPELAIEVCIEINKSRGPSEKPIREVRDIARLLLHNHKELSKNHTDIVGELDTLRKALASIEAAIMMKHNAIGVKKEKEDASESGIDPISWTQDHSAWLEANSSSYASGV